MRKRASKCEVYYDSRENKIVVELPITLPTSLVRIKDMNGNPVGSVRKQKLRDEWYIEWQVSYLDEGGNLVELGKMFEIAVTKAKMIGLMEVTGLYEYVRRRFEMKGPYFENAFPIEIIMNKNIEGFEGFRLFYRKIPILRKYLSDNSFIHIELKHKQKAVGYQAMLYIYIPLKNTISKNTHEPPIGREASVKELVLWYPMKEHIIELMKAFSMMSRDHASDIMKIIEKFKQGL